MPKHKTVHYETGNYVCVRMCLILVFYYLVYSVFVLLFTLSIDR